MARLRVAGVRPCWPQAVASFCSRTFAGRLQMRRVLNHADALRVCGEVAPGSPASFAMSQRSVLFSRQHCCMQSARACTRSRAPCDLSVTKPVDYEGLQKLKQRFRPGAVILNPVNGHGNDADTYTCTLCLHGGLRVSACFLCHPLQVTVNMTSSKQSFRSKTTKSHDI